MISLLTGKAAEVSVQRKMTVLKSLRRKRKRRKFQKSMQLSMEMKRATCSLSKRRKKKITSFEFLNRNARTRRRMVKR